MHIKDEFSFEALKYQSEDLNFSLSNSMDFWKIKENQRIFCQKLVLPVCFRQYDKSRNLINIINDPNLKKSGIENIITSERNGKNGFSFSAKPKPMLLEENLEQKERDNEEVQFSREKITHFSEVLSENDKNYNPKVYKGESPIRKALYIQTV